MKILSVIAALMCGMPSCFAADLIPPERKTDWTPGVSVGVVGGIPTDRTSMIDVTQPPYNADRTGTANASPAIQSALDGAANKQIVYLPAGRYRIDTALGVKSFTTLRGAGPGITILDVRVPSGGAIGIGSGSDYKWEFPASGNAITAGLGKGSTTVTIGSTSDFRVGQLVQFSVQNENNADRIRAGAVPVMHVMNFPDLRRQMLRVGGIL